MSNVRTERGGFGEAALPSCLDVSDAGASEPGVRGDERLISRGWLHIGLGCLIAGQAMVFSFAMNLSAIDGGAYWVVHGLLIAAASGALVFLGGDLMRSAWGALRERRVSVDLLFLVTLCGAFGGSLVSTFTRTGAVYYEVVAVLIVVHTAGKMLGARSRAAALRAVDETRERFEWCEVVTSSGFGVQSSELTRRMRVRELRGEEIVRVGAGGGIPVDGVIVSGRGFVQEASMTGEWRPVSRGAGERVLAGTFSVDGVFEIAADAQQAGGRKLDKILAAVEQARLAPSVLQEQGDRLIAWFLPLVVCVSVATFAGWFLWGGAGWAGALFNAMAVLLVACPCAMGLATPVAVWSGLARLAGFGLVARSGDFLDALAKTDFVCFDKTGTLSESTIAVREWRVERDFAGREAWLQACVAALEEGVAHPVAEALCGSAGADARVSVSEKNVIAGRGVRGVCDGVCVAVGLSGLRGMDDPSMRVVWHGRLARDSNAQTDALPQCMGESPMPLNPTGESPVPLDPIAGMDKSERAERSVFVFVNEKLAATVVLEEKWRGGLSEAVEELRALGVGAEVLTGDAQGARAGLPLPVRAGLSPEGKAARVAALAREGKCVLFVGDGVNDASAMSGAHAAIAMQGGAGLAKASAMAVFAGEGLLFLPRAIRVARAARRSVFWNLRFAACYNVAGMTLAAAGVLHPVVAALLMVGSSAVVSASALRGSG